jgi:P-type conjugative transfer protein TrbJ
MGKINKVLKILIYFSICTVFYNFESQAGTVLGNGGSTELTQIANNTLLGQQLTQMIEQVKNLQQQLEIQDQMLTDTKRQGKSLDNYQWGNIQRDFDQITRIVRMGQGISYTLASVDEEYRRKYKGFDEFKKKKEPYKKSYDSQYSQWSETNLDTVGGAMKAANMQSNQFSSEDRVLKELQTMSQTAEGRHQALQVGHQIAVQEVHQLQKLRALQLSQMQMQAAYQAQENSEKSYYRANRSEYFGNRTTDKVILGNGKKY